MVVPTAPEEMMLDVIDFYDLAVDEGWLSGGEKGRSGETIEAMFRDMLVHIYDLIVEGNDQKSCRELSKITVRIDGTTPPRDLVSGEVAPVVYGMLSEVFVALECYL